MDVFIRNVPNQASNKQLGDFLRPYLEAAGIDVFHCNKFKNKPLAILTVLDPTKGKHFLEIHGDRPVRSSNTNLPKCNFHGQPLLFSVSNKQIEPELLRSLQKEVNDRLKVSKKIHHNALLAAKSERKYPYVSLACGIWDHKDSNISFISHFSDTRRGVLMFGNQALALLVETSIGNLRRYRLDFAYSAIQSITLGDSHNPSLTFTLSEAPKIFGVTGEDLALHTLLNRLRINSKEAPKRSRLSSIGGGHEAVVGSCFVYRLLLEEPSSLRHVGNLLKQLEKFPPSISCSTSSKAAAVPFYFEMFRLLKDLAKPTTELSFGVKFQLQRLAQNGFLTPGRVSDLVPEVSRICSLVGGANCEEVVRKLLLQIPFAGPEADPTAFDIRTLIDLLHANEEKVKAAGSYRFDLVERYNHMALIYKAFVTPTGIFLEGPEPECKNRVLRKYSSHTDYFLRVSFLDENGEQIRYDKYVSLKEIYHVRFKNILEGAISVAGREFEFLGFSHSSLREQTCWFMAPFMHNGANLDARGVIAALGDFSSIRSPAKCAARIGQAFSETNGTVRLTPGTVQRMPDVERNGRVFSDGVGIFSTAVLQKVWQQYSSRSGATSRLLQIRWAGAKGMISLDTRLEGERVLLRPSQVKFESPDQDDIEICGSASCLPMRLNRQFIKIMEDLGVEPEVFMQLQSDEVDRLRQTTASPVKAASFLERSRVGGHAQVPWLLRKLQKIGLEPLSDPFLGGVVELATLLQLRELKYRSRIPVEAGVTLYGIMDETDTLEEGEIFCRTAKKLVEGIVTITRAPALHPGDVRLANCVNVANDSPLNALHNCIVFSSRGARDLPSQLSGGDLDGDLYQLIWNNDLRPKFTETPADYPRPAPIDIGRLVERADMTRFFIQFMENDQLGRIATLHQQLADTRPRGTLDQHCLILANMHSTAVDFSKTGIPVDITSLPRYKMYRPDFMATGPRCLIESKGVLLDSEQILANLAEDDLISELDPESSRMRYYESDRVLGQLYRAIDEHEFLDGLKKQSRATKRLTGPGKTLIDQIWSYATIQTHLIEWEHYKSDARDIRDTYEDCLVDTMYQYSASSQPLTETEVFVGSVLGKDAGVPNRRLREAATDMKAKFDRDLDFTIGCIVQGLEGDAQVDRDEALARSIACLSVAIQEPETFRPRIDKLESFAYVAAAVCLKEIEIFHGSARKGKIPKH